MQATVTKPVILSVFGTRPEAAKMCPLAIAIDKTPSLTGLVCVTGQHRQMLDQVLGVFGLTPDYDLNIMRPGQTLAGITAAVLEGLTGVLAKARPDVVLVHGDTTTSFAAALAAFYQRIPVGHVEAGLRTYDRYSPFPEEMNRTLTGRLATLHFAPTARNVENLRAEGITDHVYVTGNTVIDALRHTVRPDYVFHAPQLADLSLDGHRVLLMTAHRRENLGQPLRDIFAAIRRIVEATPDLLVLYPVHLNPEVQRPAREMLGDHPRIHLIDPLEVDDMHNLMARSDLILTDSGGLQEEAPSLGKPVLVLRTETERPEAVEAGTVQVVGVQTEAIVAAALRLLEDDRAYARMAKAANPYGDGQASQRIVAALQTYLGV